MTGLQAVALNGFPEVEAGDDLAELIAARTPAWPDGASGWADGDIVVVTATVVSKALGPLTDRPREQVIAERTAAVVATRLAADGSAGTQIVRTRGGLVLAAAGVDASNVPAGTVLPLPDDPDAEARQLRHTLRARLEVRLGIVLSDTLGRPWRLGQTDAAVGAAGITPLASLLGHTDPYGNPLEVTCPVDGTVREAEIDTCSGCGTKFTLGAKSSTSVVLSSDGPPEGGAAIA